MSKEEILKEIDAVEDHIFNVNMIDHWSTDDYDLYNRLSERRRMLRKQLKDLEQAELKA